MTRNEYLEKLSQALYFLDDEIKQSTLAFYAELLDDRMEDGMTEEDAVAAMEDADLIARRMRQEHGEKEKTSAQNTSEDTFMPCVITYGESDLSSLNCTFIDRPIVIEPSDSAALTISYTENVNEPLEYIENGGRISLTEHKALARRNITLFGIPMGNVLDPLFRGTPQIDPTVHIKVPADILLAMDITTTNGKINASGLTGMGSIRFRSSNGAIHLAQIRCKQLNIHTSNARITLDQVSGVDALSARSSNGRIQVNGVTSRGVIDLRTSNSRIIAEECTGDNMLYLQTSNGSIETKGCRFPSLQLKTSNGNINGTLPGGIADYSFDCRTSNGFCNLPKTQPGGSKTLLAHTSNGSINLSFENQ